MEDSNVEEEAVGTLSEYMDGLEAQELVKPLSLCLSVSRLAWIKHIGKKINCGRVLVAFFMLWTLRNLAVTGKEGRKEGGSSLGQLPVILNFTNLGGFQGLGRWWWWWWFVHAIAFRLLSGGLKFSVLWKADSSYSEGEETMVQNCRQKEVPFLFLFLYVSSACGCKESWDSHCAAIAAAQSLLFLYSCIDDVSELLKSVSLRVWEPYLTFLCRPSHGRSMDKNFQGKKNSTWIPISPTLS